MIDASNPEAEQQIRTCYEVLEEIGVDCSNVLLVLNKVDQVPDPSFIAVLRRHYEDTAQDVEPTGTPSWEAPSLPLRPYNVLVPICGVLCWSRAGREALTHCPTYDVAHAGRLGRAALADTA